MLNLMKIIAWPWHYSRRLMMSLLQKTCSPTGETGDVVIVNGKDINKVKQLILVYKTEEWAYHKRLGLRRLSKFEEVDENHFKNPIGKIDFMKATNNVREAFEALDPENTTIIIEPDLIDDPAFAELNHQYKEFLIRQIFKPAT